MSFKRIDKEGNIFWYNDDGEYHREDGPAVVFKTGTKTWFINGLLHREGGPAVEYSNGEKQWWIDSTQYTEQEYKAKMRSKKLKQIL